MTWTEYLRKSAKKQGIDIEHDDVRWLMSMICHIPVNKRETILTRYVETWVSAMRDCKEPVKAANAGRRAANTYMRELLSYRNF